MKYVSIFLLALALFALACGQWSASIALSCLSFHVWPDGESEVEEALLDDEPESEV